MKILILLIGMPIAFICFCCGGCGKSKEEVDKEIKSADKNWDAGNKLKAIEGYKSIYADADASQKKILLLRIVDTEMENKNDSEVKKWIEKGLNDKLDMKYTSAKANAYLQEIKNRIAETKRLEQEQQKIAEEERKKKAENEYEKDGIVLLKKTVTSSSTRLGIEIEGTVENRTGRKLSYVQITYHLYDESGAKVGTAVANINNLEKDRKWNFKAVGIGDKIEKYKLDEIIGY